jgi:hypothetical protein
MRFGESRMALETTRYLPSYELGSDQVLGPFSELRATPAGLVGGTGMKKNVACQFSALGICVFTALRRGILSGVR